MNIAQKKLKEEEAEIIKLCDIYGVDKDMCTHLLRLLKAGKIEYGDCILKIKMKKAEGLAKLAQMELPIK